jgi:glycosyltransferase involved in cell wall biosynthesis
MRVAHLACVVPPEIGGIGRVAVDEVAHLRAIGVDAVVFAPKGKESVANEAGITRLDAHWRVGNAATLPKAEILRFRPDVIHLHYPFYGTAEPWLWRRSKIPVVVTFHMDATPTGWRGMITSAHQRIFQSFFLRHADRIIVSSRDYAERSSLSSFMSLNASKVQELPFAVDTNIFSPRSPDTHSIRELLFVGGMDAAHHFKGVNELLEALAGLARTDWRLRLVGDGDLRTKYEEQARRLGIEARVQFCGRISQSALVSAYRESDLLLFPSTTAAEAFGLVALEAQSCGVPVIASNLPGVRTVVRDRETGLLVPPRDVLALRTAIERLIANEEERVCMGKAARARTLAKYSWEIHTKTLETIYKQVCASRS